jgi:hypothetical protein
MDKKKKIQGLSYFGFLSPEELKEMEQFEKEEPEGTSELADTFEKMISFGKHPKVSENMIAGLVVVEASISVRMIIALALSKGIPKEDIEDIFHMMEESRNGIDINFLLS